MRTLKIAGALAAILILAIAAASAADPNAARPRIDIRSRQAGVELQILSPDGAGYQAYHAGWIKDEEEKKRYITFRKTIAADEWDLMEFAFQANQDTRLDIILTVKYEGEEAKEPKTCFLFDGFETEGAALPNPGFEENQRNEKIDADFPAAWIANADETTRARIVTDQPKEGKQAILVGIKRSTATSFDVKAAVPVKIKLWVKRTAE